MEADANLLLLSSDVYWEQDAEFRFIRFSGANQTWVDSLCKRAIGTRFAPRREKGATHA